MTSDLPAPTATATAVDFAAAARVITTAGRRLNLPATGFRCPPRVIGVDRSLRRRPNGAVIAVRLEGRPFIAVLADMIEGVVQAHRLGAPHSDRVRRILWASCGYAVEQGQHQTNPSTSGESSQRAA